MSTSRYPFTDAVDYLRERIGDDYGKGLISRSAAAQAMQIICEALGHKDGHFAIACAVADMAKTAQEPKP